LVKGGCKYCTVEQERKKWTEEHSYQGSIEQEGPVQGTKEQREAIRGTREQGDNRMI
jgi:hypothetical protein